MKFGNVNVKVSRIVINKVRVYEFQNGLWIKVAGGDNWIPGKRDSNIRNPSQMRRKIDTLLERIVMIGKFKDIEMYDTLYHGWVIEETLNISLVDRSKKN